MGLHVRAPAAEFYPFRLQPEALFQAGAAAQLDFATCPKHPLPGQTEGLLQHSRDLTGTAGKARGACYGSVRGNFSRWDLADGGPNARLC